MADQNDDTQPTSIEEAPDQETAEDAAAPAGEDPAGEPADEPAEETVPEEPDPDASPFGAQFSSPEPTAVVARPRRRATRPRSAAEVEEPDDGLPAPPAPAFVSFVAPAAEPAPRRRRRAAEPAEADDDAATDTDTDTAEDTSDGEAAEDQDRDEGSAGSRRRRRGRRGRGRGRSGEDASDEASDDEQGDGRDDAETDDGDEAGAEDSADTDEEETGSTTRRRRRRRRRGGGEDRADEAGEDGGRATSDDDVRGVSGSTRLEAKRQRRRDGRDSGRRRTPILTESEFLARREAVDRKMVIRQRGERTQIAVLEDDVLVEHYVTQAQGTSFAGNVYLGRVQNVLPSMEAAFVDIGKGRNAVLYAGEVNWEAAGLSGKQRSIEQALKSGDKVLVQVTKDPIGHKGARLTQQINLPGRFLVYVPGGSMTGISRKLPDTERQRLKDILKKIVPDDAGVIIRTAAEGASEDELTRDVNRLKAQWEVIEKKAETTSSAPTLLYGEPDLAIRVIRDVFNEDFKELVVQGDDAWDTVEAYVAHVSPELSGRLNRYTGTGDVFHDLRIDEQLAKALDRKVWLPSGGSLVIDRTEAMTVIDVNTGKFTGSGGNLEQTVTRNNMEAAEEIVRQLRLRDIGGIIVIDFIDMVLESNRDLVLRRMTECLGRDRTKHQVAEVTSLGLVQMTRKRVGQGLLEVFSEPCEHCRGRGVIVHTEPVDERRRGGQSGGNGRRESGRSERGNGGRAEAKEIEAKETEAKETEAKEPKEPKEPRPAREPKQAREPKATEVAVEAEEESPRVGGRRARGRRGRGSAGEDTPTESGAEEAPDTGTADVPAAAGDGARGTGAAEPAHPVEPSPADGDGSAPDEAAAEVHAPLTAQPRRRRAASRPAGPPA